MSEPERKPEETQEESIPLEPSERAETPQEPAGSEPRAHIDKPSVLEGIDEDELIEAHERDEAARRAPKQVEPSIVLEMLVKPMRLEPALPALLGGAFVVSAATLSGTTADGAWWRPPLLVLLWAPIHALLGAGAAWVESRLEEVALGRVEVAASRSLLAVGAAAMLYEVGQALNLHPLLRFIVGAAPALAAYYAILWSLYGRDTRRTSTMTALHAALFLVFWIVHKALTALEAAPGAAESGGG